MPSLTDDIANLQSIVTSLLSLISHCQSSLHTLTTITAPPLATTTASTSADPITTSPNHTIPPLSLLHDASSLARAHTTKLALLLTQSPPPTPLTSASATTKILTTIHSSILPPLLTSLNLLHTYQHGKALIQAVARPVGEILRGLGGMVGILTPFLEDAKVGKQQDVKRKGVGWEILKKELEATIHPLTGKIWAASDTLIKMKERGLVGIVSERLAESVDTIKDAEGELREYLEKHSPSIGDGHDQDGDEDDDYDDDFGWDDFPPSSTDTPPPHKKHKRKLILPKHTCENISVTLKRFKTLTILLSAIQKRRLALNVAPALGAVPDKAVVERLDGLVDVTEEIVALVDEVVGGYYELEGLDGGKNRDEDEDEEEVKQVEGGGEGKPREKDKENTEAAAKALKSSTTEQAFIQKVISLATLAQPSWDGSEDASSKLFGDCIKAVQR